MNCSMDTRISADNPFGYDRYGYAWQQIPEAKANHLDFGCFQGRFLEALKKKGPGRLVGADISREAIGEARRRHGDLEFVHVSRELPLEFEDKSFRSVTVMDVIEHVAPQKELLKELGRIMQDNGTLIVTVPGKYLFSFLDMGNFKFRFPRLHRWYYCRKHSRAEYERRYVSNPDGLIGDVSAEKGFHEHFTRQKLESLLNSAGFTVVSFDGSGFFSRPIGIACYFVQRIKPLHKLLQKLIAIDARLFKSANLFCNARRIS